MTPWPPSRSYRYSMRKGNSGHDVAALQLNLDIEADGEFGPKTDKAVREFQRIKDLAVDGIAGPVTQRRLALDHIHFAQKVYDTPPGMLRSLCEAESGWMVGAVNWNSPGGVDCGWAQWRVLERDFSDERFRNVFDGDWAFERQASRLRAAKEDFYGRSGAKTHQRAWELAVLNHNWPAGAEALASGRGLSEEPAAWVVNIGVPGVTSPMDWAHHYIDVGIRYVSKWVA